MKVKRFSAATMQQGLRLVREELGADAVILSTRKVNGQVEIMATLNYDEQELRSRTPEPGRHLSTSELVRQETDRHRQLQDEMEKSRQRIAAVRQSTARPAPEPLWPDVAADEVRLSTRFSGVDGGLSKAGQAGSRRQKSDVLSVSDLAGGEAGAPEALAEMRAEISMLKDLLTRQLQNQSSEIHRELEQRMSAIGVFPELQKKLLEKVRSNGELHTAWRYVLAQLTRSLKTTDEELIEKGGIYALLGPTGSGKTTTIGKLAARYVMKYGAKDIALVTTDRYRIASHEQLKAFGRILGVPVRVVDDNHSLDAILDTLRSKKLILIDTAGLNHHEKAWSQQMGELRSSRHRIQNHLVVSAINQPQVMKSTYHCYKSAGLSGCVITKLDEAMTLGEAMSLAIVNNLPVAYVTDGQKIPDDIHQARANQLVTRMLAVLNEQEQSDRVPEAVVAV